MIGKELDIIDMDKEDITVDENTTRAVKSSGEVIPKSKCMLVVTHPDLDIDWQESYLFDSWKGAYGKMIELILESSGDDLESELMNGQTIINVHSAQTFTDQDVRCVYHIISYRD